MGRGKDKYYNRAKQQGYRSRAAFKLKQLDRTAGLFGPGNTVVDLGRPPAAGCRSPLRKSATKVTSSASTSSVFGIWRTTTTLRRSKAI